MPELPATPFAPSSEKLDWWVKIVGMLQHNWALPICLDGQWSVLFVGDTCGMFDRIDFEAAAEVVEALRINGFTRYEDDRELHSFLAPPEVPLHVQPHPNGFIYSSGRYWRS